MIGVFDSGLGGVLTATYIQQHFPGTPLLIFADQANLPYGDKSGNRIHDRTFTCLHWLFDQGCSIVIMACNTASTHSIVERQARFPEKKVLSVTIPGVEAVIERDLHSIVALSTPSTCKEQLYSHMFVKHYADYPLSMYEHSGENLVSLIEDGADDTQIMTLLQRLVKKFPNQIDGLILGCTHYPLIEHYLQSLLPTRCTIINPGKEAAHKLVDYCNRHKDISDLLATTPTTAQTLVATTGSATLLRQTLLQLLNGETDHRDCLELTR